MSPRRHRIDRAFLCTVVSLLGAALPGMERLHAMPLPAAVGTVCAPALPDEPDCGLPPDQPPEVIVLANSAGVTELDSAALRAVFRGERERWPSARRVTVVLPSSRVEFASVVSRMLFRSTPGGMQRYWLALVFQGRAAPPVFVDSIDEMIAFVRQTPGAIAMVPRDSVNASGPLLVRVR